MPDITIQINTPQLVAGESFKTRYRLLPAGAWSSYVTRTNAAFTLTGLSVGTYELEVIVVKDDTECPAIIRRFDVVNAFECIEFEAEIVQVSPNNNLYELEINYTIPGGFTNPPCGWKITVQGNTTNKTVTYTTLPTPPIKIPVNNEGQLVRVIADLCGKTQNCFEGDISPVPPPPCTGLTIVPGSAMIYEDASHIWHIQFDIVQSAPATTSLALIYQQFASPPYFLPGLPDQGTNNITLGSSATQIHFTVNPTYDGETKYINYNLYFKDRCGNVHAFSVSMARW